MSDAEPTAVPEGIPDPATVLPGIDAHPHARAVLAAGLPPRGEPSHAYLFHGPSGTGKRAIARAFAAALLIDGARDPANVAERVARDSHPDCAWVRASGATEVLVGDIEKPVVEAATRTPFESTRRVFVIEDVDTMNEQAANRMLKTLEEPPAFVHLLLLTDRREDVLATVASRCQPARFDPPALGRMAEGLGLADPERAHACASLALGDASLASYLAGEAGGALRGRAENFVRSALAGTTGTRPWQGLLELARAAAGAAGEQAGERIAQEVELLPKKERKRYEREGSEARRRGERRVRMRTLDMALRLGELWLRDMLCICEGAPELIHAVDRRAELEADAAALGRGRARVRRAIELVQQTRMSLSLNVSEELALEALAYRLEDLLAAAT